MAPVTHEYPSKKLALNLVPIFIIRIVRSK